MFFFPPSFFRANSVACDLGWVRFRGSRGRCSGKCIGSRCRGFTGTGVVLKREKSLATSSYGECVFFSFLLFVLLEVKVA